MSRGSSSISFEEDEKIVFETVQANDLIDYDDSNNRFALLDHGRARKKSFHEIA